MKLAHAVSIIALTAAGAASADCDTVVMSDVGWTDITTTTATAKHVLEGLGYEVDVKVLSVPVTFASLESDDVDVFLGNWMPAQTRAVSTPIGTPTITAPAVDTIDATIIVATP